MKLPYLMVLFAVILIATCTPASATALYGTVSGANCCPFTADSLIRIDMSTGAVTKAGDLDPMMRPLGLGFRGSDLYVVDQINNAIRKLNPQTGAVLATVALNVADVFGEGDVTFRSDGVGFYSDIFGLRTFDVLTGNTQFIGALADSLDGLAFDGSGVLYGYGQNTASLYTVNTATAALTVVGATGLGVSQTTSAGLAFAPDGRLFFNNGIRLYTLNKTTGAATLVGDSFANGNGISGLAFDSSALDTAIPEPATFMQMGAALVMVALHRRRK